MTTRLSNEVTVHYTTSSTTTTTTTKCEIENGQGDGICTRTVRVTGGDANCYITTLIKWGPWSDSHRRIRVYETRPVAAEAQGLKVVSTAGIAPATSAFAGRRSDLSELRGQNGIRGRTRTG